MAAFLSDEWCESIRGDAPGAADCGIEVAVVGGPGGDVTWHLTVAAGAVRAAAGPLPGADVALTVPYEDMVAIAAGELEPSVAFMRGRMKTAGDPGRLLDVLRATVDDRYRSARDAVAVATDH